jgi:hypothetical protein
VVRSSPTDHISGDSRGIPRDSIRERTVEAVPKTIGKKLAGCPGSVCLYAWDHHPRPRSSAREGGAATTEGILRPGSCLQSYADMCASKGRGDDAEGKWSKPRWRKPVPDGTPWSSRRGFFLKAPTCAAPAATSKSRFHRSKRGAHADAGRFFYPRPLLAEPAADFPFVPLAGATGGLLRRDSPLGQPLIDVPRMKRHPKLSVNQIRHPGRSPEFGGEAKLGGRPLNPPQDMLFLPCCEFGQSAWCGFRSQTSQSLFAIGLDPSAHGSGVDPQKIGHFLLCITRAEAGDRQPSPAFQLGARSVRSHILQYAVS